MSTLLFRCPRPAAWVLAAVFLVAACKKDKRPRFDPDERSGPDGKRSGALLIPVNMTVTDDVNFEQRDQTDWKQVELKGRPGVLEVEIFWDNVNADINCAVFNSLGQEIATSPGPTQGQQRKRLAVEIAMPGVYYLRVQAPKKGDFSVYSLIARWNGEEVGQQPQPEPVKTHRPSPTVSKPPKPRLDPDRGVQGRIVTSFRQGDALILYIDKGSAAGIKEGDRGTVLDGPSGAKAALEGEFTVTQVVDERKCVAKTGLKSLGRNSRVSINASGNK